MAPQKSESRALYNTDVHNCRPVTTLKDTMRRHNAHLRANPAAPKALLAFVFTTLLSGCSVWQSIVEPPALPAKPVQFVEPSVCTDCVVSSKSSAPDANAAVTISPVVVPAKAEIRPLEKSTAEVVPTARTAPEPVHGYYINVGLFAIPANAASAYQRLRDVRLPATSEVVDTKSGSMTRVRVGPYAKRSQADAAAKKVRAAKLDAYVLRR